MSLDSSKIDIKEILTYFSCNNVSEQGKDYNFSCPFPDHLRGDRNPSAYIHSENLKFHCFSCGRKGSLISFVAELEEISYATAERLIKDAYGGGYRLDTKNLSEELKKMCEPKKENRHHERTIPEEALSLFYVNWEKVYEEFSRGNLSRQGIAYPYFRGITLKSLIKYNIGYDKISERITIPIRTTSGDLFGIKGRTTKTAIKPRYLSIGDKKSVKYGFQTNTLSDVVWGLDTASEDVIIVEGEFDAIVLRQYGYEGAVALGGSAASKKQLKDIRSKAKTVTVFLDNDNAGMKAAPKIAHKFAAYLPATICVLPEGDPTSATLEEIQESLNSKQNILTKI